MKNFSEDPQIEVKTLDLVQYYVRKYFGRSAMLKAHGFSVDDLESDVCWYVFKTSKKGETFLNKMEKIKTLKHHRAFVKRAVINMVMSREREFSKKPIVKSLDYILDDTDDAFEEIVADPRQDTERKAILNVALSKIKKKYFRVKVAEGIRKDKKWVYKNVVIKYKSEECELTNHLLIELLIMNNSTFSLQGYLYAGEKKLDKKTILKLLKRVKRDLLNVWREM